MASTDQEANCSHAKELFSNLRIILINNIYTNAENIIVGTQFLLFMP
jgi:hypothetical protein